MLALYQTLVLRTLHLNFLHDCTASRGVKAGFQNFKLNFRNQSQVDGGRETEGAPVSTQQPKAGFMGQSLGRSHKRLQNVCRK